MASLAKARQQPLKAKLLEHDNEKSTIILCEAVRVQGSPLESLVLSCSAQGRLQPKCGRQPFHEYLLSQKAVHEEAREVSTQLDEMAVQVWWDVLTDPCLACIIS